MTQSTAASKEMNQVLLEYFDPKQLLIFRAGILFTFISPSLRGIVASYINTYIIFFLKILVEMGILMSIPAVCSYGPSKTICTSNIF